MALIAIGYGKPRMILMPFNLLIAQQFSSVEHSKRVNSPKTRGLIEVGKMTTSHMRFEWLGTRFDRGGEIAHGSQAFRRGYGNTEIACAISFFFFSFLHALFSGAFSRLWLSMFPEEWPLAIKGRIRARSATPSCAAMRSLARALGALILATMRVCRFNPFV